MRSRCLCALNVVMSSKIVPRGVKLRTYKTVMRLKVIFGNEVWNLGMAKQRLFGIWERKCLRKILNVKIIQDEWERRTKRELRNATTDNDKKTIGK